LSPVSYGIGDDFWHVYHPNIYPGNSGPLSLAIPPWVGAMSNGDGFSHLGVETAPLMLRPYGALKISLYKYGQDRKHQKTTTSHSYYFIYLNYKTEQKVQQLKS